jgi:hypothetical protein
MGEKNISLEDYKKLLHLWRNQNLQGGENGNPKNDAS